MIRDYKKNKNVFKGGMYFGKGRVEDVASCLNCDGETGEQALHVYLRMILLNEGHLDGHHEAPHWASVEILSNTSRYGTIYEIKMTQAFLDLATARPDLCVFRDQYGMPCKQFIIKLCYINNREEEMEFAPPKTSTGETAFKKEVTIQQAILKTFHGKKPITPAIYHSEILPRERGLRMLKTIQEMAAPDHNAKMRSIIQLFTEHTDLQMGMIIMEKKDDYKPYTEKKDAYGQLVGLIPNIMVVLNLLHRAGFIHGDLHRNNILWRESDDDILLIDFGRTIRNTEIDLRKIINTMNKWGLSRKVPTDPTPEERELIATFYYFFGTDDPLKPSFDRWSKRDLVSQWNALRTMTVSWQDPRQRRHGPQVPGGWIGGSYGWLGGHSRELRNSEQAATAIKGITLVRETKKDPVYKEISEATPYFCVPEIHDRWGRLESRVQEAMYKNRWKPDAQAKLLQHLHAKEGDVEIINQWLRDKVYEMPTQEDFDNLEQAITQDWQGSPHWLGSREVLHDMYARRWETALGGPEQGYLALDELINTLLKQYGPPQGQ